ncbi:E3 SUMO-protein ligase KIAA1586-like [Paramormyrops kingsleyae]|uniref:E3 SUMO-protein ligase KIAA1586-like n=1 Tax=Paramormyrops kingsleyae TaxID=1676925 RepID=UPI003B974A9C
MKMKRKQATLFDCFYKPAPPAVATETALEEPTTTSLTAQHKHNETDVSVTPAPDGSSWPAVWSESQAREFQNRHPWLGWRERKLGCEVCSTTKSTGVLTEKSSGSSENRETALSSLRNKIRRHENSRAHEIAQELTQKCGQDLLGSMVRAVSDTVLAETDAVFRTAYYIAKMNRPFTDHDDLIELQEKNGVNLGTSLHSRYSCTKIVEHVAREMQTKIVNSIVSSSNKLSVLIDEATSASHKSAMIVSVKASIDGATPEFVFLELVELESQTAESIEKALLTCLDTAGFSEEWLQKNWIAFVSDGASVMLGRN